MFSHSTYVAANHSTAVVVVVLSQIIVVIAVLSQIFVVVVILSKINTFNRKNYLTKSILYLCCNYKVYYIKQYIFYKIYLFDLGMGDQVLASYLKKVSRYVGKNFIKFGVMQQYKAKTFLNAIKILKSNYLRLI